MNDGAGRRTALIYDVQGPNQLRRVGDLRFPANITNFSVATANVDSDTADELLLSLNDGAGRPTALIYDVQGPNQLRRVGDLRFPANITNFSVATANVDSDTADELLLSLNDGAGRPTALIYDVQGPNQLRRIGDLRFPTNITNFSVATANVDSDTADELLLSLNDGAGRPTALIYDVQGPNQLRRIGDLRFPTNITNFSVVTANVDSDAAEELVLAMNDGRGRPTVLVYDVQGPYRLRRIGDLNFST